MSKKPEHYQPGICNIGTDEISKRRKEFVVSLIPVLLLSGLNYFMHDSASLWILLFVASSVAGVMYLQVAYRFCIAFGIFKRYNFGPLGPSEKISDPSEVLRDRKKVLMMCLQALAMGSAYTCLVYLLSLQF